MAAFNSLGGAVAEGAQQNADSEQLLRLRGQQADSGAISLQQQQQAAHDAAQMTRSGAALANSRYSSLASLRQRQQTTPTDAYSVAAPPATDWSDEGWANGNNVPAAKTPGLQVAQATPSQTPANKAPANKADDVERGSVKYQNAPRETYAIDPMTGEDITSQPPVSVQKPAGQSTQKQRLIAEKQRNEDTVARLKKSGGQAGGRAQDQSLYPNPTELKSADSSVGTSNIDGYVARNKAIDEEIAQLDSAGKTQLASKKVDIPPDVKDWKPYINYTENNLGIPPNRLAATIARESSGRSDVANGEYTGVGQISRAYVTKYIIEGKGLPGAPPGEPDVNDPKWQIFAAGMALNNEKRVAESKAGRKLDWDDPLISKQYGGFVDKHHDAYHNDTINYRNALNEFGQTNPTAAYAPTPENQLPKVPGTPPPITASKVAGLPDQYAHVTPPPELSGNPTPVPGPSGQSPAHHGPANAGATLTPPGNPAWVDPVKGGGQPSASKVPPVAPAQQPGSPPLADAPGNLPSPGAQPFPQQSIPPGQYQTNIAQGADFDQQERDATMKYLFDLARNTHDPAQQQQVLGQMQGLRLQEQNSQLQRVAAAASSGDEGSMMHLAAMYAQYSGLPGAGAHVMPDGNTMLYTKNGVIAKHPTGDMARMLLENVSSVLRQQMQDIYYKQQESIAGVAGQSQVERVKAEAGMQRDIAVENIKGLNQQQVEYVKEQAKAQFGANNIIGVSFDPTGKFVLVHTPTGVYEAPLAENKEPRTGESMGLQWRRSTLPSIPTRPVGVAAQARQ